MWKKFSKIFFGAESIEEMKKRGLALSLAVPAFRWADWALVGATATLVAFLKQFNLSDLAIFAVLWIGNILLSWSIVFANSKSEIDFTLMEGLRRLINVSLEKSKLTGTILEALIFMRLLIWDGADHIVIFFNHKLSSKLLKATTLIVCSAIQMSIWTVLYVYGYNNFLELFEKLF